MASPHTHVTLFSYMEIGIKLFLYNFKLAWTQMYMNNQESDTGSDEPLNLCYKSCSYQYCYSLKVHVPYMQMLSYYF
jgi:hypothetical protein